MNENIIRISDLISKTIADSEGMEIEQENYGRLSGNFYGTITEDSLPEGLSAEQYETAIKWTRDTAISNTHACGQLAKELFSSDDFGEDTVQLVTPSLGDITFHSSVNRNAILADGETDTGYNAATMIDVDFGKGEDSDMAKVNAMIAALEDD